jgi:ATP-dependent Zn protease
MISHLGMGSTLISHGVVDGRSMTDDSVTMALKNDAIREEVDKILHECKESVRKLLLEKRQAVELVRDALLSRNELSGDEFRELLSQHGLIPELATTQVALQIDPPAPATNGTSKAN